MKAGGCEKGCDTPILCPAACSCPPSLLLHCQQLKLPRCLQTIETYLGATCLPNSTLGQHRARALCAARARLPFLAQQAASATQAA